MIERAMRMLARAYEYDYLWREESDNFWLARMQAQMTALTDAVYAEQKCGNSRVDKQLDILVSMGMNFADKRRVDRGPVPEKSKSLFARLLGR